MSILGLDRIDAYVVDKIVGIKVEHYFNKVNHVNNEDLAGNDNVDAGSGVYGGWMLR